MPAYNFGINAIPGVCAGNAQNAQGQNIGCGDAGKPQGHLRHRPLLLGSESCPSRGSIPLIPTGNKLELFIGTFIGAIAFPASVTAFGNLFGRIFGGQHVLNLAMGIAMIGIGICFFLGGGWLPFIVMTALAFMRGVLIIIPIGGAQHALVISMLNSYSGRAINCLVYQVQVDDGVR